MGERYFANKCPDYNPDTDADKLIDRSSGQLVDRDAILSGCNTLLQRLEEGLKHGVDWSDNSVYTGLSGYSLMYYFLHKKTQNQCHLEKAREYVDRAVTKCHLEKAREYVDRAVTECRGKRVSFICGDPGPLAVAALVHNVSNKQEKVDEMVSRVISFEPVVTQSQPVVTQSGSEIPDEHLYGRCGYLYSLILLRQEIPRTRSIITDRLLRRVISAILDSGKLTVSIHRGSWMPPLFYFWHHSPYLGAAHGIAGILYTLLMCHRLLTPSELNELIKPTLDFMLTQRFQSGNTRSSVGRERDLLVHWCHGAPGVVAMYTQAHKVFQDQKYLDAGVGSGEVVWNRGLLLKGYGLCHGIAGNGYAFLTLYRHTLDLKHLHRALKFAEICLHGHHPCRTPDSPFSLFEGMAGTVYFLFDIIQPESSLFPAYEVQEV